MDNRKLLALSQDLQGQSAADVDAILRQKGCDVTERIAVKHAISAAASGRTMHARGLATDGAEYRPLSEMDRLLKRAGLRQDRRYSEAEIDEAARGADITDPQTKLALKIECASRGMIGIGVPPHASQADRLLQALGITGPVDHQRLELKLDQLGYAPSTKAVILSECQLRGWLRGGGNLRMRASAARGTMLTDRLGNHLTLRSYPE